ncbi:hypothetical protein LCGC14_0401390 [marine sediment metagenome]|uniref:DUF4031 domain-containing protein n=1 Tax=marine sediment metagenome TaxID=412755 RepID=A0A0F9VIU9_9ZZZZ
MKMCHMAADSLDELHEMADAIMLPRRYFQDQNRRRPHYDIAKSKRALAVRLGALPVGERKIIEILAANEEQDKRRHEIA